MSLCSLPLLLQFALRACTAEKQCESILLSKILQQKQKTKDTGGHRSASEEQRTAVEKDDEVAIANIKDPLRKMQQCEKSLNYWFENSLSTMMESGLLG